MVPASNVRPPSRSARAFDSFAATSERVLPYSVLRLRPSVVYTVYWAHHPPLLRRQMLPSPFPRLPICLTLPYEFRGLDAQGLSQLSHSPGMCPLPAVLYSPDRVVGDAAPLLQFPQGEDLLSPQFLKPLHVDLHALYFALLSSQNITTISR